MEASRTWLRFRFELFFTPELRAAPSMVRITVCKQTRSHHETFQRAESVVTKQFRPTLVLCNWKGVGFMTRITVCKQTRSRHEKVRYTVGSDSSEHWIKRMQCSQCAVSSMASQMEIWSGSTNMLHKINVPSEGEVNVSFLKPQRCWVHGKDHSKQANEKSPWKIPTRAVAHVSDKSVCWWKTKTLQKVMYQGLTGNGDEVVEIVMVQCQEKVP